MSVPASTHPQAVAIALKTAGHDEAVQAIAWLHDVVEDTNWTLHDLRSRFSHRIVDGVDAMTKREGETRREYVERVALNPDAVVVKLADIDHNMIDCERVMPGSTQMYQKDRRRLLDAVNG